MRVRQVPATGEVADRIIKMVRGTSISGDRGDSAKLVMLSAYIHGYRRFRALRELARNNAGAEAVILVRSLLSLLARAAWVDEPRDPADRRRRFDRYHLRELRDAVETIDGLRRAGFAIVEETTELEAELAELRQQGTKMIPDDTQLLHELGLNAFRERIYRTASNQVHFSLGAALEGIRGVETVDPDVGDAKLADEALGLAILTYGLLLDRSEKSVRHGLTARCLELIKPWAASLA